MPEENSSETQEAHRIVEAEKAAFKGQLIYMPLARRRRPRCSLCGSVTTGHGRDRRGRQRWRCKVCRRMYSDNTPCLLEGFYTSDLKLQIVSHLLAEGISQRGAARVVHLNKRTVAKIAHTVGALCRTFLAERIVGIPSSDVEVDEVWTYVFKKQFRKTDLEKKNHKVGSAWLYVGIDRKNKLILAHHLGRRTVEDACEFMKKLRAATVGNMTVYTDGFQPYPTAIYAAFLYEGNIDSVPEFLEAPAVIVRNNGLAGQLHDCEGLDYTRACTNQVERFNATLRGGLKRMARRTHAFSKSWYELENAIALFLAYYNFCKPHGALNGKTPAMVAGLTERAWDMRQLLINIQQRKAVVTEFPAVVPSESVLIANAG